MKESELNARVGTPGTVQDMRIIQFHFTSSFSLTERVCRASILAPFAFGLCMCVYGCQTPVLMNTNYSNILYEREEAK